MTRVTCTVKFIDRQRVEHTAEVQAASLYEAACRGWAVFKSSPETFEESYKTEEFIVEVHQTKTFKVNLEKLLAYLDRGRRGHLDTPKKREFRRILDDLRPGAKYTSMLG